MKFESSNHCGQWLDGSKVVSIIIFKVYYRLPKLNFDSKGKDKKRSNFKLSCLKKLFNCLHVESCSFKHSWKLVSNQFRSRWQVTTCWTETRRKKLFWTRRIWIKSRIWKRTRIWSSRARDTATCQKVNTMTTSGSNAIKLFFLIELLITSRSWSSLVVGDEGSYLPKC